MFYSLNQAPIFTDDFSFRHLDKVNDNDAIVVLNPAEAMIVTPVLIRSKKTLEEHIKYIQINNIRKAIVAAEDIGFLSRCPSLEYLWIIPAITAEHFDYSPVYELPNLKWFRCETMYGLGAMYEKLEKAKVTTIDYSRLHSLRRLAVSGAQGNLNVHAAVKVVSLQFISDFPKAKSLSGFVPGDALEDLFIAQSPIQSLSGIEVATKLRKLVLSHCRSLTDIESLRYVKDTLGYLEINTCGKICDFSVLNYLKNIEFLTLKGSNTLCDLSFLKNMPKLKNLTITMNVVDGDLSLCEQIPYTRIQNRKHYTHKNQDLQKNYSDPRIDYSFDLV